jgi:ubiquinone/menaquinone biosynthesis C-methylase UbiE
MHVLDLGCGVGDVSFLAAGMVGAAGTVLGIDRNASSIETARRRATALGLSNVRFEASELDTFNNDGRRFDALIGRLVLLFLPDPAATLRRFRNFLRPGGVIAFQEVDMDQVSQFPALSCSVGLARGSSLGSRRVARRPTWEGGSFQLSSTLVCRGRQ